MCGPLGSAAEARADATVRLTELASGAGCGCKLPAGALLGLLARLPEQPPEERLLVGSATSDDAGVFRIGEDLALVQTVDFFTPPVDDPFDFGRIAAANALSDVYAMGAEPLTALNIVAFPLAVLGEGVLGEVLRGGLAVAAEAGVQVLGGHSIEDAEPKYGLAVTGIVRPRELVTNAGGRVGDVLLITKPLGVGAVLAARKRGQASDRLLEDATETMTRLNAHAAEALRAAQVHAMTDVTGFGLLGHLHHICRESGLAAELYADQVPALDGVAPLLESEVGISGGARSNAHWAEAFTSYDPGLAPWRRRLLADPATSGGLLAALPSTCAEGLPGAVVGRLVEGTPGTIRVI
jgi:selenide,water dikinase